MPTMNGMREAIITMIPFRKSKINVSAAAVLPKQRYTFVSPAFLLPKSLTSLPDTKKVAIIAEFKLPIM